MNPMQNIRCLIIDDEAPARAVVRKYLSDIPGYDILAECKNAFEANEAIQTMHPDLIFLDINMPKLTGLKLLESLRNPPQVIITTAYREYALESFELDVVDYLHKPFSLERFIQALNKARNRVQPALSAPASAPAPAPDSSTSSKKTSQSSGDFIFLKEDGRVIRIDLPDIFYIEAVGDYLSVETRHGKHLSYLSMKKMINLLPDDRFARIHKSYIVNLARIGTIDNSRVYLGEKSFPIGATFRAAFMELVKARMG